MPLYKVWNATRKLRYAIVASTLEELKEKGAQKLGIHVNLVVQEEDGTEIDETEVMLELAGGTFILLDVNEHWNSKQETVESVPEPNMGATRNKEDVVVASGNSPVVFMTKGKQKDESKLGATNDFAKGESSGRSSLPDGKQENEDDERSESADSDAMHQLLETSPLPTFSPLVERHLREDRVQLVWNTFITETAQYYYGKWPLIDQASHYRIIGSKMYKRYPCIGTEGKKQAWSFFTKTLSQKIRHLRFALKAKSKKLAAETSQPQEHAVPSKKPRAEPEVEVKSKEDMKAHMEELKVEWAKTTKNSSHIKMLLKETRIVRDEILAEGEGCVLKEIVDTFPCFKDVTYVLYEFTLKFGKERLYAVSSALKKVVTASLTLMKKTLKDDESADDSEVVLEVLKMLEEATKFQKGGQFRSVASVFTGIQDAESMKTKMTTKRQTSPTICVFKDSSGSVSRIYITGDGTIIKCKDLLSAILGLMALCYCFDLAYPLQHSMFLGFLQTYVFSEPYTGKASKNLTLFNKSFREVFHKL